MFHWPILEAFGAWSRLLWAVIAMFALIVVGLLLDTKR